MLGDSLSERTPPAQPFGARDREARGSNPGDLVDAMIEDRIALEKVEVLEGKMRYQIEKLVRIADEPAKASAVADGKSSCFFFWTLLTDLLRIQTPLRSSRTPWRL